MRQLTPRETIIVAIAVALAVALPLYLFVFGPELDTLRILDGRIATQSRKLASVEAGARRLPALQQEHAVVAGRLREIERRMPARIAVSGVMGWLSAAIAASGVQLIEVTFPAGTQPAPAVTAPVQELPFTVRFRGTFSRVVIFLHLLESPPVIAVEQSLSISGGGPKTAGGVAGNQENLEITMGMKAVAPR